MGGKTRIAPQIAAVMRARRKGAFEYVEPFMGGGSVAALMAPEFQTAYLSDANESLIMLWQDVLGGWKPPGHITKAEWDRLKADPNPSAMKALAGFAASFGGKWFAGYAHSPGRNYVAGSTRELVKHASRFQHAKVECMDYLDAGKNVGFSTLVYCDPPYEGTTGYGAVGSFNSAQFWDTMREWSNRGASVFVSEYTAPEDFVPVWRMKVQVSLAKDSNTDVGTEQLFTYRGGSNG
jgi:DNA adenine methylase